MRADPKKVCPLVRTARGQVDAVLKMMEDDRYCIDIINQLLAAESLLKKARSEVLSAHLEGCVQSAFESGSEEERAEKIREISALVMKLSK